MFPWEQQNYATGVLCHGWVDAREEQQARRERMTEVEEQSPTGTLTSYNFSIQWPVHVPKRQPESHWATETRAAFQRPDTQPIPNRPDYRSRYLAKQREAQRPRTAPMETQTSRIERETDSKSEPLPVARARPGSARPALEVKKEAASEELKEEEIKEEDEEEKEEKEEEKKPLTLPTVPVPAPIVVDFGKNVVAEDDSHASRSTRSSPSASPTHPDSPAGLSFTFPTPKDPTVRYDQAALRAKYAGDKCFRAAAGR